MHMQGAANLNLCFTDAALKSFRLIRTRQKSQGGLGAGTGRTDILPG